MSSSSGEQRFDEDILRCKEEILRLKGVIPPFGRPPKRDTMPHGNQPQSFEPATRSAPSPDHGTPADAAIKSTPVTETPKQNETPSLPEPIEAPETPAIEETSVKKSDELYDELQKPAMESEIEIASETTIPEIEIYWPPDKAESAEQLEESPIEETVVEETKEAQRADEGQFEAQLDGDGAEEDEGEFRAENNSALATIEQDLAKAGEPQPESDDNLEIPGFDLAQQIMAEQRKIAGNRRKGPGSPRFAIKEEKLKPPAAPPRKIGSEAPMSPQQRVIAEIVARDINRHYQISKVRK